MLRETCSESASLEVPMSEEELANIKTPRVKDYNTVNQKIGLKKIKRLSSEVKLDELGKRILVLAEEN